MATYLSVNRPTGQDATDEATCMGFKVRNKQLVGAAAAATHLATLLIMTPTPSHDYSNIHCGCHCDFFSEFFSIEAFL